MTTLGFMARSEMPEPVIRSVAKAAEDAGCSTLWINNPPGQDGLTPIAWALDATSSIRAGSGVVPVSHHPPAEIARRLGELGLPAERYRLGVGSGQGERPRDRVRAALRELRPLGYELVVGALGPVICRLAGEEADGLLLNAVTPAIAAESAALAREGASSAGRPAPRIAAGALVGIGAEGRERLAQSAAFYASLPFYVAHFERTGLTPADFQVAVDDVAELGERLAPWRGVVDEVVVMVALAPDRAAEELPRLVEPIAAAWHATDG
jgi:alkanesulfonate monooxygenase SsuD/methylene tetrahydromethanopterin reductase-like flavin-dependent oxidoreductase (luciferase family)